ncbi:MAG TPA: hypothetical protein VJV05_04290 [Pyrinomonadaceae bacterium]|nr:hypothetical protein [Pyrinomonadaceae bacterium]
MKTASLTKLKLSLLLAVVALATVVPALGQGSFFGAIYTTKGDGTTVNQNVYDNKSDVFLNGGPQNQNSQGLPDGTYYFQVTAPSGALLLSSDLAECRQVQVIGGVMAGSVGPVCRHANATANDSNGSIGVQLVPYDDTTNAGGEYKVWLIRQASTTTVAPDGVHINFLNSNAKTDNFKIRNLCEVDPKNPACQDLDAVTLSGHKFYDANGNSINDSEAPVEGIRIHILVWYPGSDTSGPANEDAIVETDASGDWTYGDIPAGSVYRVSEILPDGCEPGSYWLQTAPVADNQGFQGYTGTAFTNVTGLDFGDICFTQGTGGFTLGFWSNKNGQRRMETGGIADVFVFYADGTAQQNAGCGAANTNGMNCDLAFLRRFNLRNTSLMKNSPNGSHFDPATYTQFREWLLNGNAINMAYMLSVQLSANSLNVRHETLFDDTLVDGTGICNSAGTCLGLITIGEVRQMANESLGNFGFTVTGDAHREDQEVLKNFLDAVNNNRLGFANDVPCGVCYPVKE